MSEEKPSDPTPDPNKPDYHIRGFPKRLVRSQPIQPAPLIRRVDAQAMRIKALNQQRVKQARSLLAAIKMKSWDEFGSMTSVPLIPPYVDRPFNFDEALRLLAHIEVHGASVLGAIREQEKVQGDGSVMPVYHKLSHDIKFSDGSTLRPQQQKAFEAILELYLLWLKDPANAEYSGAILPLKPGKGKSYITAALIKYLQENKLLGSSPFARAWVLCPAGQVLMKTIDKFEQLGVHDVGSEIGHECIISSHQSLSTKRFKQLFKTEIENYYGNDRKILKFNFFPPKFANVDESHLYKKMQSSRTQYAMSWVREAQTFWLFTSASISVNSHDTEFMSLSIRPKYMKEALT